jgi:hypothetical protein
VLVGGRRAWSGGGVEGKVELGRGQQARSETGLGVAGMLRRIGLWAVEDAVKGQITVPGKELVRWLRAADRCGTCGLNAVPWLGRDCCCPAAVAFIFLLNPHRQAHQRKRWWGIAAFDRLSVIEVWWCFAGWLCRHATSRCLSYRSRSGLAGP